MAAVVPGSGATPSGSRRRDWHTYDNYRLVHDQQMNALFDEGVVVRDTQRFRENTTSAGRLTEVNLRGRVYTASGAVLVVNKWLEVRYRARVEVRTHEYAYHAFVRLLPRRRDLFRYDNCHGGLDTLHYHRFGPDGEPQGLEPVSQDELPWLSEIIRETEDAAAAILRA